MNKLLIPATILASTNMLAGLSANIGYGVLFPLTSKSVLVTVHEGEDHTPAGTTQAITVSNPEDGNYDMQLKNSNYFDVGLAESDSGLGILYSATVKDTKFVPVTAITDDPLNMNTFTWKYQAMFVNYRHKMGEDINVNLAIGSAKQTFGNDTGVASIGDVSVSQRDLAARFELGYSYQISKSARMNLAVGYHYFKDFVAVLNTGSVEGSEVSIDSVADASNDYLNSATPAIKPSGLAASVALELTL